MVYEIKQVSPFQKETEKLTIYHISIKNQGEKLAEDVKGIIDISPAIIMDFTIKTEFPLEFKEEIIDDKLTFNCENINSNENINISILASSKVDFPDNPLVKIRAKGCSAIQNELKSNKEENSGTSKFLLFGAIGIIASIAASFVNLKTKSTNNDEQKGKHTGVEQQHVLAYLLDLEGFKELALEYRKTSYELAYWSESDSLTFDSQSKDNEYITRIINVQQNILDYVGDLVEDTEAIINYNISKLFSRIEKTTESEKYLKIAISINKELIEKRMNLEKITAPNKV